MAAALAASKGKRKTVEAPEPTDHRPNLSDVHISDVKYSHSNFASPRGMQAAELEPQPNNEQLLHMLSTMRKQMKYQQIDMIQLREEAAREKEAATRIHTRLLKQIGTLRKSQSFPTAEGNVRTHRYHCVPENLRTPPEARGAIGRRPTKMMTLGTPSVPKPRSSLA